MVKLILTSPVAAFHFLSPETGNVTHCSGIRCARWISRLLVALGRAMNVAHPVEYPLQALLQWYRCWPPRHANKSQSHDCKILFSKTWAAFGYFSTQVIGTLYVYIAIVKTHNFTTICLLYCICTTIDFSYKGNHLNQCWLYCFVDIFHFLVGMTF